MANPDPNDPCPCGSGKTYEACCMEEEADILARGMFAPAEAATGPEADEDEVALAIEIAARWLHEHHPEAVHRAVEEGFFGQVDPATHRRLVETDPELQEAVSVHAAEWLVAQAELEVDGESRPALDLVLSDEDGPPLESYERAFLEDLREHRLGIWDVVTTIPGKGFVARDLLATEEEAVCRVADPTAAELLIEGEVFGGRLLPTDGEEWSMSLCFYALDRQEAQALADEVRGAGDDEVLAEIVELWLESSLDYAEEGEEAEEMRHSSGDPLRVVTDRWDVLDWDALSESLADEPGVEGSREEEGWNRADPGGDEELLQAIQIPVGEDRIEVIALTRALADGGRSWLEETAGDALRFLDREVEDPRGGLAPWVRRMPTEEA